MKRLAPIVVLVLGGCGWDVAPGAFCETAVKVDASKSGSMSNESTAFAVDFEQYDACSASQATKVYTMTVPAGKSLTVAVDNPGAVVWMVRGSSDACDYPSRYTCGNQALSVVASSEAQRIYVGVSSTPRTAYQFSWTVADQTL